MGRLKVLTPEQKAFRRKWVVLFSALESLVESGIKLAAAIYTGSTALLADAIHSSADVAGSLLVWIGVRLAPQKFSRFPYGFYKIENLLALMIGFAILFGAYEILQVFLSGGSVLPTNIPVGIAAVIVGMLMDYFWGRYEADTGRLLNSPGIEASGEHTLSDVLSSVVVLVGLVGALFGFDLDRWAALLVALLVARMGVKILWDNLKILLDISLPEGCLEQYRKVAERQAGVREVRSLRGRSAGGFRFVDIEVVTSAFEVEQANRVAENLERALKEQDEVIDSVFVHYRHELPKQILVAIPTDLSGGQISSCFGKSSHFVLLQYDREKGEVVTQQLSANPYLAQQEHRGIRLAAHLAEQGVDSVCCREDLKHKGPGLMLHHFGIDLRSTELEKVEPLMAHYLEQSEATYPVPAASALERDAGQPLPHPG